MTNMSGRPILVAGATGRQGGSVVRHLLQRRLAVRALVQNPHSDRAKGLADQGIEIAQGDMDDLTSLIGLHEPDVLRVSTRLTATGADHPYSAASICGCSSQ